MRLIDPPLADGRPTADSVMTAASASACCSVPAGVPAGAGLDLRATANAVADGLRARGFDVRISTSERCCSVVTNIGPAVGDLTIGRNGIVDWKYACPESNAHEPDEIAAIALDMLDADEVPSDPDLLTRYPDMSFLGRIGLAAVAHDLRVAFDSVDPVNARLGIHDELTVTNPERPRRGTVQVTIDGAIWWRCQIRSQSRSAGGLALTQITGTVALALTSARYALPGAGAAVPPSPKYLPAARLELTAAPTGTDPGRQVSR